MLKLIKKIDVFLDQQVPNLLLLLVFVFLRVPNLIEPYWYGDEGIYLTLGIAMRQGERLYSEIIDHKTPLIYYFAMVPNQFWFRVLNIVVTFITVLLFKDFAQKLFKNKTVTWISTFIFILLTSLPTLEGNIPNGELFVMFFIMLGGWFLTSTSLFQAILHNEITPETEKPFKKTSFWPFVLAGFCFGLAILTKVPALFDAAGFFSIGWFALCAIVLSARSRGKKSQKQLISVFADLGYMTAGMVLPIVLSVLYFILRGSGKAYLDYGLLYNFRYAGSWQLGFQQKWLVFLFTFPGKLLLLGIWVFSLSTLRQYFRPRFQFLATWFGLSLFAALLSNRPYPHYFLQIVPPLVLLLGYFLSLFWESKKKRTFLRAEMGYIAVAIFILGAVLKLLNVHPYPTISYYQRFFNLTTHKISTDEYRASFNDYMKDNYEASKIIVRSPDKHLLIWGTNPMLYALSKKSPVGRFTVQFHIRDFKAEGETIRDFEQKQPEFAVIDKSEKVPDELYNFLYQHYMADDHFEHFVLWKKLPN
jgi:hypothetical protein